VVLVLPDDAVIAAVVYQPEPFFARATIVGRFTDVAVLSGTPPPIPEPPLDEPDQG